MPSGKRLMLVAGAVAASVFTIRKLRGGHPEETPDVGLSEEDQNQAAESLTSEPEQTSEDEPAPASS
jgi:hypothetical protein